MAGTNEILSFGLGVGANVQAQSAYNSLLARTNGFSSGVADSSQVNKVLRQSAFMARVLSQWAVDQTGGSILDNADETNAKTLLTQSVQAIANALLSLAGYATIVSLNANVANLQAADATEATLRNNAVAAEAAARAAADSAEAVTRANADTTEANARATQDANLLANFANYVAKGGSSANHTSLLTASFPPPSTQYTNTLSFTAPVPGYLFIAGHANIDFSIGQPLGCLHALYLDGSILVSDNTLSDMSHSWAGGIAAGTHSVQNVYITGGGGSGSYNQTGVHLSYIFVPQ